MFHARAALQTRHNPALRYTGLGHCACSSELHRWKGRGCLPAHAGATRAHMPCARGGGEEEGHPGHHAKRTALA